MAAEPLLGLQGTVDFEVRWDPDVIGALAHGFGITAQDLEVWGPVVDERSLVVSYLAHFRAGRGGEIAVRSTDVVLDVARHLEHTVTLGGTGVRAALVLRQYDLPAAVHLVSTDDNVRRLLPAAITVVSSATRDTLDPHLIMQYPQGGRIAWDDVELVAPFANRVIFTDDPPARDLVLSPELGDALAEAPVFLLSGLNAIRQEAQLADRIARLRSFADRMPDDGVVVYEDAGFHDPELGAIALRGLRDDIDVYSLNEDELEGRIGGTVALDDPAAVAAALRGLRALAPHPTIMLHTKYFALALGSRAGMLADALANGVRVAASRYVHGDASTPETVTAVAGERLSEVGRRIAGALPGLVDEPVVVVPAFDLDVADPTTIGLGDTFMGGVVAALTATAAHDEQADSAAHAAHAEQAAHPEHATHA